MRFVLTEFYTDISISGNNILVRGYENGRRIEEAVKYKPFIFIPSNRPSTYKTLEGHNVERINFPSIGAAHNYLRQYEGVENFKIYGQTSFDYLYIWDKYRGEIDYNPKQISVVILDIETDFERWFWGYSRGGSRRHGDHSSKKWTIHRIRMQVL